ncbi:MAG: hypothetical protein O7B99_00200 [Planctomycetota bacterium]|nr:hypothetical protein [Planctomycetota bacterium]
MHRFPQVACALLLCAPVALASDFDMAVLSGGGFSVTVLPGETVDYQVVGRLTDNLNEGLAAFRFDLEFDGGGLPQADAPTSGIMLNFTNPLGWSNPAGFGGTLKDGKLLQIGGAQNTINNSFPVDPSGGIITGVAWPGSVETLVTGSFQAPFIPGNYTLSIANPEANVIRQGETGNPFWACDYAPLGLTVNLDVTVISVLDVDVPSISIATGGTQNFSLDAGVANAGRTYFLAGTTSGTSPGTSVGGITVPLNSPDPYLDFIIANPNQPPLFMAVATLDSQGKASASFMLPPGTPYVGFELDHAYVLLAPIDFASNSVHLSLLP